MVVGCYVASLLVIFYLRIWNFQSGTSKARSLTALVVVVVSRASASVEKEDEKAEEICEIYPCRIGGVVNLHTSSKYDNIILLASYLLHTILNTSCSLSYEKTANNVATRMNTKYHNMTELPISYHANSKCNRITKNLPNRHRFYEFSYFSLAFQHASLQLADWYSLWSFSYSLPSLQGSSNRSRPK